MKKLLTFVFGLMMLALPAVAQAPPSGVGPFYAPDWYKGYVPPASEWQVMWSNKVGYYPNGIPVQYGGTGATTPEGAAANLGVMSNILADGKIYIGSSGGVATPQTPIGDLSMTNGGNFTVTKTQGVNFGYFATGTNAAQLTGTAPASVLPQFSDVANGAVPASGGGTTNFLRADGVWAVAGAGSVTSVGVSGGTTGLSFSNSPVTSAGTMTASGTLSPANGGTGVNNGSATLTLAGNVSFTGAFASSFTIPGAYTYTMPGLTTTIAGQSGSLTSGNVLVGSSDNRVLDSGLQAITSMSGNALIGNMSGSSGAPAEITTIAYAGQTTCAAPPYTFASNTNSGMAWLTGTGGTGALDFCAGGNLMLQMRNSTSTAWFEMLNSGSQIFRVQGSGGNTAMMLAAQGNGDLYLGNNGGTANAGLARFKGPATAGNPSNIPYFLAGDGNNVDPTLQVLANGTTNTNPVGFRFVTLSRGTVKADGTVFQSFSNQAIVNGNTTPQQLICASATPGFCIWYGLTSPTFTAPRGSLYIQNDATTATSRLYINTNGSNSWATFTSSL